MDRGGPEEVEVCKVLDDVEILSKLPKEFSNKIVSSFA